MSVQKVHAAMAGVLLSFSKSFLQLIAGWTAILVFSNLMKPSTLRHRLLARLNFDQSKMESIVQVKLIWEFQRKSIHAHS